MFLGATGLAKYEISTPTTPLTSHLPSPNLAFPLASPAFVIPFVVLANTVLEDFMLMKGFLD